VRNLHNDELNDLYFSPNIILAENRLASQEGLCPIE